MNLNNFSSKKIGIVGLGLIGGSLGLELQERGHEIYGLVHRTATEKKARERRLAQIVSTDPSVIADCQIVILALPLDILLNPSKELIEALPKNAVITDVGSVKAPISKVWSAIHERFIPSHPMAGTEEYGVEAGKLGLFKNKPWVITPMATNTIEDIDSIKELAISIGSQWIITEADLHDQAVALISHLPVLVSASLLKAINNERNPLLLELCKKLASTGFKDTTRVGGGNPDLGRSMIANNTEKILKALGSYRWSLEEFEEAILNNNWKKVYNDLDKCNSSRPDFLKK